MRNRFRIEIYDEVKSNDLTMYSQTKIDKEHLTEIVFSNLSKFQGNVKAYVFDSLKKKKTTALFLPMETTQMMRAQRKNTAEELGLV